MKVTSRTVSDLFLLYRMQGDSLQRVYVNFTKGRRLLNVEISKSQARTVNSYQRDIKCLELPVIKSHKPNPETVTNENQHEKLAETVTPFYNIPYEKQLSIKYRNCAKVLHHLGSELKHTNQYLRLNQRNLPCNLEPVHPSPVSTFYRNKDEFSFGYGVDRKSKVLGLFIGSPKNKDTIVCVEPTYLSIVKPEHVQVAKLFQEYVQNSPFDVCPYLYAGHWKNVIVRSNKAGHIMAVVIMHPQQLTEDELEREKERIRDYFVSGPGRICDIKSLYFQTCRHLRCSHSVSPFQLLHGEPYITETIGHVEISISPGTFAQVNPWAAEVLYETISEVSKLTPDTTVVDLGCGSGSISLFLAKDVHRCVGIEQLRESVSDANLNKELNGVQNALFFEGQASKVFPELISSLYAKDLVVVANPSRGGLTEAEVNSLRECKHLRRIIYVSCKPTGNAYRNFVQLCQGKQHAKQGRPFVPVRAIPVDMFPQTDHCELVIVFERLIEQHL